MQSTEKAALIRKLPLSVLLLLVSVLFGCNGEGKQQASADAAPEAEANWENVRSSGEGVIYRAADMTGKVEMAYLEKNKCWIQWPDGTAGVITFADDSTFVWTGMAMMSDGNVQPAVWIMGPINSMYCPMQAGTGYDQNVIRMAKGSIGYNINDAIFKFYGKGPYRVSTYGVR